MFTHKSRMGTPVHQGYASSSILHGERAATAQGPAVVWMVGWGWGWSWLGRDALSAIAGVLVCGLCVPVPVNFAGYVFCCACAYAGACLCVPVGGCACVRVPCVPCVLPLFHYWFDRGYSCV